jgi:hypothetical protein
MTANSWGAGDLKERDPLKDQEVDGRIILKLILHNSNGRLCFGLIWLRTVEVEIEGFCKDDDELSDSIKYGEFLTDCNFKILKKGPSSWCQLLTLMEAVALTGTALWIGTRLRAAGFANHCR